MMNRRSFFLSAAALVAVPAVAFAGKPQVFTRNGAALSGYDAVSYFSGGPTKGSDKFSTKWKGATWRFSSAENLAAFKASPQKYAPQYGGYCAFAVANGLTAPADPKAYHIRGGKLYVNLSPAVLARWKQDIPGFVASANQNWPKVLNK
jgi:YHS domain-containing protein